MLSHSGRAAKNDFKIESSGSGCVAVRGMLKTKLSLALANSCTASFSSTFECHSA